jgi:hypothetical protein
LDNREKNSQLTQVIDGLRLENQNLRSGLENYTGSLQSSGTGINTASSQSLSSLGSIPSVTHKVTPTLTETPEESDAEFQARLDARVDQLVEQMREPLVTNVTRATPDQGTLKGPRGNEGGARPKTVPGTKRAAGRTVSEDRSRTGSGTSKKGKLPDCPKEPLQKDSSGRLIIPKGYGAGRAPIRAPLRKDPKLRTKPAPDKGSNASRGRGTRGRKS